MTLYAESEYPVREDLAKVHASQLDNLGKPGTWGGAAQRQAVILEAREACYEAGVLSRPAGAQSPEADLPAAARRVARQLAVAPQELDQAFYQQALKDGLGEAEYVEIVGLVSRIVNLDLFAKGIGVEVQPLPQAQSGEPTRTRPEEAVLEQAWVPTVPDGPEGGQLGESLYGGQPTAYIDRALSLVPEECHAHMELGEVQYLPGASFFDWNYQHHEGLSRAQVELIAARVSAFNECFY